MVLDHLSAMFLYKSHLFALFHITRRPLRFLCNSPHICPCDRSLTHWLLVPLTKSEIEDILIHTNKHVSLCMNCNHFLELHFIMFKSKIISALVSARYIFPRNILTPRTSCRWLTINFISRTSLIQSVSLIVWLTAVVDCCRQNRRQEVEDLPTVVPEVGLET